MPAVDDVPVRSMKTFYALFAASTLLAIGLPHGETQPHPSARFYAAIRVNDLSALRSLVRESGVGAKDEIGNSPLLAAMVGSTESVRILLDAGTSPNEAYATGEALVALREAGIGVSEPTYRRGVAFLLRTQGQDGTWHVASRAFKFQPYFESGFPYGGDQWISQQGTAYAAMALANATGQSASDVMLRAKAEGKR